MVTVVRYSSADQSSWNDFVEKSKNGTFLFHRNYMDYHADRFADFSIIAKNDDGRVLALFPANRLDAQLVSHGGLTYGGMVSDSKMTTSQALDVFGAWIAYCKENGIREIVYKAVPSIYHRGPAEEDKYALFHFGATLYRRDILSVVDSQHPFDFQKRRERGVAKAIKSGIVVSEQQGFGEFWPILEKNLERRHSVRPVHTLAEITRLKECFPQNIRLFCAGRQGEIYVGIVLYYAFPAIHVQYIASDEAANSTGALDLLFWEAIQMSRQSARYFDFGISNEREGRYLNRGLVDFKEGFGARAICQDFYRLFL